MMEVLDTGASLSQSSEGNAGYRPITLSLLAIAVIYLVVWIIRFVKYRHKFKSLHGPLKSPPFTMLFGTIPVLVQAFKNSPADAHPHSTITLLHRNLGLGWLYFMDNWPAAPSRQMVIVDPGIAAQVSQSHVLPKHKVLREILLHICGPTSMIYTEGELWRKSRSLFNSGFSIGHLMTLVPGIVEDVLTFKNIMAQHAESGEIIHVEKAARFLTIDVMGRVVLDFPLNSQTSENELVKAFLAAVAIVPDVQNPFALHNFNLVASYNRLYYERQMDNYLSKLLDERLKSRDISKKSTPVARKSQKPIIDLALDEYLAQQQEEASSGEMASGNADFKRFAIDQMKTFLLAGHDTTSSALAFVYYLLGHHPKALLKLRKEFDGVFGLDPTLTADQIRNDAHIINKLDYATAVIKETLRLFPPVTAARQGDNTSIEYGGVSYSTADHMVWIQTHSLHRRPDLFPSPDEFIPERFLPAPHNTQEVPKDAWRPFEKGPRGCIGQELAMLELKIILALTLREFDVKDAYEEYDRKMGREKPGDILGGKRGAFGYRGYQILEATAKPVDGMPVTVTMRVT